VSKKGSGEGDLVLGIDDYDIKVLREGWMFGLI
jgi:hypothetical protein